MPQGTFHPIRARSHLLQLLGDELIGDDRLAIFELVKNGYDADANTVEITVNLAGPVTARSIIVQDSGVGMSLNDITTKWLELATDSKRRDRASRTPVFHRRALGEKGVGRIAAFKLGRHVSLTTRAKGQPEYQVEIDWNKLLNQGPYLESLSVRVVENEIPMVFSGAACGTRIAIRDLRREDWSRGDIRKLYRLVTSLASPFEVPDQFEVKFRAPGREADIKDMVAPNNFLDLAVWKFEFEINGRSFDWKYEFSPPHWKKLKPRTIERRNDRLLLAPLVDVEKSKRATDTTEDDPLFLNEGDLSGIGPIKGQIYAYHRRSEVLSATGSLAQVKSWLDDQTGVRVYRDGVRVFTYGERSDDWLGLNVRRINTPAGKLGTNSVVAAVHLDLESSNALREKTNREGFDQNPAFERLRRVVLSVFEHFEREHADDRRALDDALKGASGEQPIRFAEAIQHLRAGLKGQKLEKTFEKEIDAIEREFVQLRDVMTNSGMAGLNGPWKLDANAKYLLVSCRRFWTWQQRTPPPSPPLYRLRAPLVNKLLHRYATWSSRPGVVEFR